MELVEPVITQRRGSFHGRYIKAQEERDKRYARLPSLLDCMEVVMQSDDPAYLDGCAAAQFAVVDVVTKEKAIFELPYGATPAIVTALIEGHFGSAAFRVGPKLWFV